MAGAHQCVKWKTITANVKDATAELRALAMDMLGLNAPQRAFATV